MPDDIGKALLEYSIYVLFAASLIGNIVQYFVARRDERKRVLQQRRYEVYTEYFSKLDRTNERLSLAQNSEASLEKFQSFLGRLGSASPEHRQQLKDEYSQLLREQVEILLDWRKEVMALSSEANKARLLASDKTEQLIVELEEALSKVGEINLDYATKSLALGMGNIDASAIFMMAEANNDVLASSQKLRSAMRLEIGASKR